MKFLSFSRAALTLLTLLCLLQGCQSPAPSASARPSAPATDAAATIYFYWDAPRRTPNSLAIDINDQRVAKGEEREVLTFPVPPGETRLKIGFAGILQVGSPKKKATITMQANEKRYFLFTDKKIFGAPIYTPYVFYSGVHVELALLEVDSAQFARITGATP